MSKKTWKEQRRKRKQEKREQRAHRFGTVRLAYCPETVHGLIPTTPHMRTLRVNRGPWT